MELWHQQRRAFTWSDGRFTCQKAAHCCQSAACTTLQFTSTVKQVLLKAVWLQIKVSCTKHLPLRSARMFAQRDAFNTTCMKIVFLFSLEWCETIRDVRCAPGGVPPCTITSYSYSDSDVYIWYKGKTNKNICTAHGAHSALEIPWRALTQFPRLSPPEWDRVKKRIACCNLPETYFLFFFF